MKRKLLAILYVLLLGLWCYFSLRYVFYYNNGNNYYRKMDYTAAIEAYEHALDANPPEEKECSIRVNMALAIIKTIGSDYASPEQIETTIETLKEARDVLLEKDCATEEGDGHSEPAQTLKEEIDAIIEELEKRAEQMNSSGEDDETEEENKPDEEENTEEQDIKEQLQQNQSDAFLERQEEIQAHNNGGSNTSNNSVGENW